MKNLMTYLSKKSLSLGNGSEMTRKWFGNDAGMTRFSLVSLICLCMLTIGSGNAWGDYTLVYTLDGTTTGGDNGYATESSITQNSKSWKVTGNTTMNPWRIGGKSISKVDRPIYSTSNFADNISKVEVALGTIDGLDNIHSVTLIVSTSSNGDGTVTNTEKKTSGLSANSTVTFTRPSGQNWSSKYFKVVFNVTESSSSNKYVQLKSIKLYKTTYTVSYNSNGGSGTMTDSSSPYNEGATVTVKSNTFTAPTGKAFNSWNTASGGGGTSYAAGATFTISANTTLYAQWESAAVCGSAPTVSNGSLKGSVSSTSSATAQCTGGITSLGSAGCSITSYGFAIGTSTGPTIGGTLTGTGKTYQVGTTYTVTGTGFEKLIDGLSAGTKYFVRPYATNGNGTAYGTEFSFTTLHEYTLTYKETDGTANGSGKVVENATSFTNTSAPSKVGHDLEGFYTSSALTTKVASNARVLVANIDGWTGAGGKYTKGANADLYLKWTPTDYTITTTLTSCSWSSAISSPYTYDGVASAITRTVNPSSGYGCPTNITVTMGGATLTKGTDYTWSVTNGVGSFTLTKVITGNVAITITAQPMVTWMAGGSVFSTQVADANTALSSPGTPSPATYCPGGKVFVGWSANTIAGTSNTQPTDLFTDATKKKIPAGGITYYAVYATSTGSSSTSYAAITSGLASGNYVIAYEYNNNGTRIALQNIADNSDASNRMEAYALARDGSGKYANPSDTYIWQLQAQDGGGYYIYDLATGMYLNATTSALQLSTTPTKYDIAYDGTNSRWTIQLNSNSSYYVHGYTGTYTDFRVSTSGSDGKYRVYLYKNEGTQTFSAYATTCCTDWSTPTVTYSSSLAINASEGVTIGSGTTHGDVTYESSDEDVLTVDADGTIHAVGAGTAHITATWAGETISSTTYCEKSANSNDVTVSGIQVTGTTPVNFGQVYQNAVIADKTIYVTGLGLASDITPSLPASSPFSFSPASLAKDCSGATLTISASTATLGTYNQTLTLTSGAFSTTVTVKMEVIAKPTATFTDALHNLTEDEDGISLSSYNLTAAQGTPVVFPRLANQTKSAGTCEGEYHIFVGWTEGDNNTDPQDHLVTSHTLANGDAKHYYAVWADASGSATYTKLTSDDFKTSPTKYVLGGEDNGTKYFLYTYSSTDADLSWGECSSSEAPIQFTLSGATGTLVAQDASGNYLAESSAKKKFKMSSTSATVQLQDDGTIETEYFYLRYNHNSGSGGLRYYESESSEPAYFYEVSAGGTVHYRTSCCSNKVDAPVVTATAVTSTSITLTWPADVKATGWEVSWNGGAFGAPSGTCTHTVSGLTPNTTYTWQVCATYTTPQCGADIASGSTTTNQVYHVTYAKGSGTGTCTAEGSTTDATGYEAGATVTLQANEFSLSGHTFAGWTEDDDDITISSNQFTMPDHDVVITASWTAKMDKYFDRMHDQTDELHGGVEETEGTNEGKYYIPKEGCNYSIPTAVDSNTGDACQTSHYKLQGWIAASHMKGYPDHMTGEIKPGEETYIFPPTGTKTATGATYYAIWAEVTE